VLGAGRAGENQGGNGKEGNKGFHGQFGGRYGSHILETDQACANGRNEHKPGPKVNSPL
jgi:hypothetical protein